MKLWLDDVRPAPKGWAWARTFQEAKQLLEANVVSECSLDHDLGLHELDVPETSDDYWDKVIEIASTFVASQETGLDLVDWMIERRLVPAAVTIHSWNPAGAHNMAAMLVRHGYECTIAPYKEPS